jgi:hypothetical protein
VRDQHGKSALWYSIQGLLEEVTQMLLKKDVSMDVLDERGMTVLHLAARKNLSGITKRLLQAGQTSMKPIKRELRPCCMLINRAVGTP